MRAVSIVGIGQIPIAMQHQDSLRQLGAAAVRQALADASVVRLDALYAGNMLADELQGQKHIAALIADEAGQAGVEALQVRAATAAGAAALRMAYLAVASGAADLVVACGLEKMSQGVATPVLAKALDARREVPDGATLVGQAARLMQLYLERYRAPADALAHFSVNAHANARHNPVAVFRHRQITADDVQASRLIVPPVRLLDCAPICDGAAAVVLSPSRQARRYTQHPVRILASSVSTDRFRMADRPDPLSMTAARLSAEKAYSQAGLSAGDIDLFEVHDAFTIMACLCLEASCFAAPGEGWRLAAEGEIGIAGRIPIATMGGLKARGHPIGATALYQACELVLQLTGRAGASQVGDAQVAMMQSVGGVASTVITHIFGL